VLICPSDVCRVSPGPFSASIRTGGLDIRDRILGDALLLVIHVENARAVACAHVVALTVARRWIVNLEEKLERCPVAHDLWIKNDLDGLRLCAVVSVSRVGKIAAAPDLMKSWSVLRIATS
jgi:hypothetical protein